MVEVQQTEFCAFVLFGFVIIGYIWFDFESNLKFVSLKQLYGGTDGLIASDLEKNR